MMSINYKYFDSPSTEGYTEYELTVYPGVESSEDLFSFGFCSGEDIVCSFSGVNGKLYDNDGNFIYSYKAGQSYPFEIYGNIYNDRHNYSIDRIPVNLNCSKTAGDYIDSFFYDNESFKFGLSVKTSADAPPIPY
jgi:hypothetical protein